MPLRFILHLCNYFHLATISKVDLTLILTVTLDFYHAAFVLARAKIK